jgi:hypothetical protein
MARIWQKDEGRCHFCHWWQERNERRITAMTEIPFTEILSSAIALIALFVGFAALIHFARKDAFAAPGTGYVPRDEFGPLTFRRRPS